MISRAQCHAKRSNDITEMIGLVDAVAPVGGKPGRPRQRPEGFMPTVAMTEIKSAENTSINKSNAVSKGDEHLPPKVHRGRLPAQAMDARNPPGSHPPPASRRLSQRIR